MINIPGLDTSRWSITDHNDFLTGFVKEMLRGWWEDVMLRAAPEGIRLPLETLGDTAGA